MKKVAKSSTFSEKVKSIVKSIPKGYILRYQDVAKLAGSPRASRAVGSIMKANYKSSIPCHRVVRSDGIIGAYNRGGSSVKLKKLQAEGAFDRHGIIKVWKPKIGKIRKIINS